MSTCVGIRCTPNEIWYSVITAEDDKINIKVIDKLTVPLSLIIPERLKFIRHTFLDIIEENKIGKACIRITESVAQTPNIERINLEAVLQELIASSTINRYYVGQISNISTKLGIPRDDFKEYSEGKKTFMELANWKKLNPKQRESVMAAFSAINI